MESALYVGSISHARHQPKKHAFSYGFFMYFLDLQNLQELPDRGILFSVKKWAMARLYRPDYFGPPDEPLYVSIKRRMEELTGQPVTGKVFGLLNLRTLGLYFSPVNFYYGFDTDGRFSHFLAEVSNIPRNERHQYGLYVADDNFEPVRRKEFKVSPFNPVDQQYRWRVTCPGEHLLVELAVTDDRGLIFEASLQLQRRPLSMGQLCKQLIKKPAMTAFIVAGIYWQALRLFLKGIPYVAYEKETT